MAPAPSIRPASLAVRLMASRVAACVVASPSRSRIWLYDARQPSSREAPRRSSVGRGSGRFASRGGWGDSESASFHEQSSYPPQVGQSPDADAISQSEWSQGGTVIRIFTVVDVSTREYVALVAAPQHRGTEPAEDEARVTLSAVLQCETGTEFTGAELGHGAYWIHVQVEYRRPKGPSIAASVRPSTAACGVSVTLNIGLPLTFPLRLLHCKADTGRPTPGQQSPSPHDAGAPTAGRFSVRGNLRTSIRPHANSALRSVPFLAIWARPECLAQFWRTAGGSSPNTQTQDQPLKTERSARKCRAFCSS